MQMEPKIKKKLVLKTDGKICPIFVQNDDANGPNFELEKKMDAEKRSMGISDYSGDIRKGGRGGAMSYRPSVSKETAPGESGSYYDKVMPHPCRSLSCPCHI